jgi:hypothetical protein
MCKKQGADDRTGRWIVAISNSVYLLVWTLTSSFCRIASWIVIHAIWACGVIYCFVALPSAAGSS